jgi:hypothetical protein
MIVSPRDLGLTLQMLHAEGIEVDVLFADGKIHVILANPRLGQRPCAAIFEAEEAAHAANWLTAAVVHFYPKSALSKVWRTIAEAAAMQP